MIIVQPEPNLFQVTHALSTPRRLARRLHRGQQQCDQHRYDRDHNDQFNKRKPHQTVARPTTINTHRIPFPASGNKRVILQSFSRSGRALALHAPA
jgi:hypothetical protein